MNAEAPRRAVENDAPGLTTRREGTTPMAESIFTPLELVAIVTVLVVSIVAVFVALVLMP
jgi:hypothetical protein